MQQQREKEKRESEERIRMEELAIQRDKEIKLKELDLQISEKTGQNPSGSGGLNSITKDKGMVPLFKENTVEEFFVLFERIALNLKWPKNLWTSMLAHRLVGKGLKAYSALSNEDSFDYDQVKAAILKAYELVPEAYRQRFRALQKQYGQTHVEFAAEKEKVFDRWLLSLEVGHDYEKLRQVMLLEEFKRSLHPDVRTHLNERQTTELHAAAVLADEYALTHKLSSRGVGGSQQTQQNRGNRPPQNSLPSSSKGNSGQFRGDSRGSGGQNFRRDGRPGWSGGQATGNRGGPSSFGQSFGSIRCYECGQLGHKRGDSVCIGNRNTPRFNSVSGGAKPLASIAVESKPVVSIAVEPQPEVEGETEVKAHCCYMAQAPVSEFCMWSHEEPSLSPGDRKSESSEGVEVPPEGKSFVWKGTVSIGQSSRVPIQIMRDTAASQTLLLAGVLPLSDRTYTHSDVLVKGIEMKDSPIVVPLHRVYLESGIVDGPVVVGVRKSFPYKGIQLLLGNDLAQDKVLPNSCPVNPIVTHVPESRDIGDPQREDDSGGDDLYPGCAVTRAMARKRAQKGSESESEEIGLDDTILSSVFDRVEEPKLGGSQGNNDIGSGKDLLVQKQREDPSIKHLYGIVVDPEERDKQGTCYYLNEGGVLMRQWRPVDAPVDEKWRVVQQIIVPSIYRPNILQIAHDHPLSGHLGVRKTMNRIWSHFCWPKLKDDVREYCRRCQVCQVVGKPNQRIPVAPLIPIPPIGRPFEKILIDCVGPLPCTKSGKEYLLTVVCQTTRYPEAVPLGSVVTRKVTDELEGFFARCGPGKLQSDQESSFASRAFRAWKERWKGSSFTSRVFRAWLERWKVWVLFPVAGPSLKARYHGPCEVESRVGSMDYKVFDRGKDDVLADALCSVDKPYSKLVEFVVDEVVVELELMLR